MRKEQKTRNFFFNNSLYKKKGIITMKRNKKTRRLGQITSTEAQLGTYQSQAANKRI